MNRQIESLIVETAVAACGEAYSNLKLRRSGVGCINETWEAYGDNLDSLFVKVGRPESEDMYLCETQGLQLLSSVEKFRVPKPLKVARSDDAAVLLMEFIQLQPLHSNAARVALGEALAEMHQTSADYYGLDHDNYIGRTQQKNGLYDSWWSFYCEQRLTCQLELAKANGIRAGLANHITALIERVPDYFQNHQPDASLLHGDLWGGNVSCDSAGKPVIYDPAVYFGDAETDIAMSQMFQSLDDTVYNVYYSHIPAQAGYSVRKHLYDLYHWLNHFNLFGVPYLGQVEQSVDVLLSSIRER